MNTFNLQKRFSPVSRDAGFRMPGYWTWDGSIIEDEDGRYHLFASRWPRKFPMHPSWLFLSEIVRASSGKIAGPYSFEEIVFSKRERHFFDGRMTHNPSIRKYGDTYLLFYIGVTYEENFPEEPAKAPSPMDPWYRETWLNKRIGLAWSKSVKGPWKRSDAPILEPHPGAWDSGITSNPSPWIMKDGSIYMAYKSAAEEGKAFNVGIAKADSWDAPFVRLSDKPCFQFEHPGCFVEDPFLWHANGCFHMIMKDMTGNLSGAYGNGIYACSKDALEWRFGNPVTCHGKSVIWDDGESERFNNMERPQLLFDETGQITTLIASTARASGNLELVSDAWVNIIPICDHGISVESSRIPV